MVKPGLQPVREDLKDEQDNIALQTEAWMMFAELIPPKNRSMIDTYRVFTDGVDNTLAAVEQNPENIQQWILDVDLADVENKNLLLSTLVHEYAHVLTLNAAQVAPDKEVVENWDQPDFLKEKAAVCPTYFTGTGCSYQDSYVNVFYNRFWKDMNEEWTPIDEMQYGVDDLIPYYNALYKFYKSHPGVFVDDYAATHPTEDIAESFTYFVFSPKPTGTSIMEQKVAFFYQYPELVQLRENILNGACKLAD